MRRPKIVRELGPDQIYNHLDGVNSIASKTGLFQNLRRYCDSNGLDVSQFVPETFVVRIGRDEVEEKLIDFEEFRRVFGDRIWILKPGENSNRGHGVQVLDNIDKILNVIDSQYVGTYKTVVLQRYIENPYLISKRKFDIRVFCLLTYDRQMLRAFYYDEGYVRTSCKEYSLKNIESRYVHLTNDAV